MQEDLRLDAIFDHAAQELNRPMTVLEFYRIIAPAVAASKGGHAAINLPGEIRQSINSRQLLPLEVLIQDRKASVLRDHSPPASLTRAEIMAINGVPISQILNTMLAVTHGYGDSPTAGPHRLRGQQFARRLYTVLGMDSPHKVQ